MRQAYRRSMSMNMEEKPPVGFDFEDEELEAAAEEVGRMCDVERQSSFDWYYTLGTVALEHYARVEQERKQRSCSMYGARFFEVLAERLNRPGITLALLSDCAALVRNVSADEYAELSCHAEISATHARILGRLCEAKDRAMFKARIIDGRLTTDQLNAAILEHYGYRRAPGGGRKPMVPKNVQAALTHLTSQAAKFSSLNQVWFGSQFDLPSEIAELPNDQFNEKLETQLKDALQQCEFLAATANADAAQLRVMLSDVQQRIAAQAEVNARLAEQEEDLEDQDPATRPERSARRARTSTTMKQDRSIGRELHTL